MRHYVLTRSVYGPEWPLEANRRRLELTRAVTAPLMAAQTNRDWTWVVLLDPRDELAAERRALFESAARQVTFLYWRGEGTPPVVAYEAYRAPWRDAMGDPDDTRLQTRLDDDDGLAPWALQMMRPQIHPPRRRLVVVLPFGVRVWANRAQSVRHPNNAMQTLIAPKGDDLCVYDYPHTKARRVARVVPIGREWGWLWVRHRDSLSGWKSADKPIDPRVRAAFPVDWSYLEAAWAA